MVKLPENRLMLNKHSKSTRRYYRISYSIPDALFIILPKFYKRTVSE